jgi:hypothetical protein
MSYISERKSRIQKRLIEIQSALDNLYTLRLEMSTTGAQSYSFNSGEGEQRTTRRSLSEISEEIQQLEASEDHYLNKLYGVGIVSLRVRRRQ